MAIGAMAQPLRAVIIGCGRIGASYADDPSFAGVFTHAGAYRACPGVELVALCDRDPEQLQRAGERWRISLLFDDPTRMLAEIRPDLVSVCTPDATHFDVVRTVLTADRVRGMLAEKPLATCLDEGRELVCLARARGIRLAVNFGRRYCRRHQQLADEVRAGSLGRVRLVSGYYTKGTRHNGSHWFDLINWILGPPEQVTGVDRLREPGEDPTLDVTLSCPDGATAYLFACPTADYSIFEFDVIGGSGRIRVSDSGRRFEVADAADGVPTEGYRGLVVGEQHYDGLRDMTLAAVRDLVDAVLSDRPPACTGEDGLAALTVAEAALESHRIGRPVGIRR